MKYDIPAGWRPLRAGEIIRVSDMWHNGQEFMPFHDKPPVGETYTGENGPTIRGSMFCFMIRELGDMPRECD